MNRNKPVPASRLSTAAILLLCLFALLSCHNSTSISWDESRIHTILYNIERAYNDHDIDALMNHVHFDYLHKGMPRWRVRELWLDRMSEYPLIDFLNVRINLLDDRATVSFTMKLVSPDATVYTDEPADNGDLSYFAYINSDWYVYGNRLDY
jgi:hypothetical protein